LHLSIPVEGDEVSGYEFPTLRVNGVEKPHLTPEQLRDLSYKFTTDAWESWREVKANLIEESGQPTVQFEIPAAPSELGRLEGLFRCSAEGEFYWHDGTSNFRGYTFAVPDRHEFEKLWKPV
jgi:hypothetical protein